MIITIIGVEFNSNTDEYIEIKVNLMEDNVCIMRGEDLINISVNGKSTIITKESFQIIQ